jgi:hypothetical protein
MGFFSDRIESNNKLLHDAKDILKNAAAFMPAEQIEQAREEIAITGFQTHAMRQSRIVKIPAEQLQMFLKLDHIPEQDFLNLRAPFPYLYIEPFNSEFVLPQYEVVGEAIYNHTPVKGILITSTRDNADNAMIEWPGMMPGQDIVQAFHVVFFMPLPEYPENVYGATFGINREGHIVQNDEQIRRRAHVVNALLSRNISHWCIHVLNYLTSPTVLMEERHVSADLQKARARRGKEPLPGWYEIQYTKSRIRYEANVGAGVKHGFRYDVRGHFMHFTKGRMAGRVIWCPPHQRGLANDLYKPKSYRMNGHELPEQPSIYGGAK